MRFLVDISKAASFDGLGSFTRELVRGFDRLDGDHEWLLIDLLGESGLAAFEALGPLSGRFSFHETSAGDLGGLGADAFLATSWTLPAAAPSPLFVAYDLTVFSHPECHTLANRLHVTEGLMRARLFGATMLAISEATAGQLATWIDADRGQIEVVHPGIAAAFQPPDEKTVQRAREKLELTAEGFVLSVGSFEPRKNLARLLDAHRRLPEELRRRFPLILAGSGGWRQGDLAASLETESPAMARHLGPVGEDDLVALYGASTLFVYPSLAEGFGLPVVEAMACGAPVLTSNLSSLPEAAGQAARLVDPEDEDALTAALLDLLENPEERRRLAELGRRQSLRFDWTESARRIAGLLEQLAGGASRPQLS